MTKKTELKIHGLNACMAVFKHRPDGIIRLYLTETRMKILADVVKLCVQKRRAYHVVSSDELAEVSGASHHEGVCLVIKLPELLSPKERSQKAAKAGSWLALEEVGNPHNLGAIQRSAAHFGAQGVFLIGPKASWETGAFYRTAEGGAEAVPLIPVETIQELLTLAQELGLTVYATSSHQGPDLYTAKLSPKAVFLLGSEARGLREEALKATPKALRIPGTGLVESLNVSAAASLLMGEWYRQHGTKK